LHDTAARVISLQAAMHAYNSGIFTTRALADQFGHLGHFAFDPIDNLLAEGDAMLAVSARRVKICSEAYAKAETSPLALLHGTIGDDDVTQSCVLATIALSLDLNR
jgi:hypothetical protein